MSKIKVLHITFDMTIGGAQQVILQLMKHMDNSDVESSVACIDGDKGAFGEELEKAGFNVYLFKRQEGFDTQLIKDLRQLIKAERLDIVHCHQYTPYFYGLLATFLTNVKVIFTEHGRFYPDYGTWKRKLINPVFSLFTSKITSISQATKEALITHENFSSKQIEVIYNGIEDKSSLDFDEIEIKHQFTIPEKVFIFGTISRLQPIKNQSMMIKAFKKINEKYSNSHLLIVGDGESRSALETLVDELKLQNYVTFTGFQSDAYRFHKIIDVFLLPSFSEGTSMTLLEAMSFSKPSVVTEVGGNPEIIKDGIEGLVVKSDDQEKFYTAMDEMMSNLNLKKVMGEQARQRFELDFTIEKMTSSFYNVYKKITKRH